MLDLLRRKEADPASASVRMLLKAVRTLHRPGERLARGTIAGWCREHVDAVCGFFDARPGYVVFPYEDFVRGRTGTLEEHLGLSLTTPVAADRRLERVARTREAGDWRNWFTQEDVAFFRPLFARYMERFGYPDDWDLPHAGDPTRARIGVREPPPRPPPGGRSAWLISGWILPP